MSNFGHFLKMSQVVVQNVMQIKSSLHLQFLQYWQSKMHYNKLSTVRTDLIYLATQNIKNPIFWETWLPFIGVFLKGKFYTYMEYNYIKIIYVFFFFKIEGSSR